MKVLLCGGGNAIHVLASYIGSKSDHEVRIWSLYGDESERLKKSTSWGIRCINDIGPDVWGKPLLVSKHAKDVVPGSDVILLALPAFAHEAYLEAMAPYITNSGVIIGALPAQGGFDLCLRAAFGFKLANACILFATETLPWACRIQTFGICVEVLGTKKQIDFSVSPTSATTRVVEVLNGLIGTATRLVSAGSFLTCTLMQYGWHPTIIYGRFRNWDGYSTFKEPPLFYEGIDEFTGNELNFISDEVLAIKEALLKESPRLDLVGIRGVREWLTRAYGSDIGDTSSIHRMLQTNKGYRGLFHPMVRAGKEYLPNFNHRYMTEDVPCGLVVTRGIAELLNIPTPHMDAILLWSQVQTGKEYLVDGRLCGKDLVATRCPQRYGFTTLEGFLKENRYDNEC